MPDRASEFHRLVQRSNAASGSSQRNAERELESLLSTLDARSPQPARPSRPTAAAPDRVQALRDLMRDELIPIFAELVEKYAKNGITMEMDASNLLEGGREIHLEFRMGDYRTQLDGTATNEAIAFNETRYSPQMRGELVSGPMLSLRQLTPQAFREFVCERLTLLLRSAVRKR
ncbi:MAG: hypothetical protein HY763_10570 [Planctomycetes bacterium]|nr:hypothetical protein [Planctomycetota bacterium]